jgi:hypothetical protein
VVRSSASQSWTAAAASRTAVSRVDEGGQRQQAAARANSGGMRDESGAVTKAPAYPIVRQANKHLRTGCRGL